MEGNSIQQNMWFVMTEARFRFVDISGAEEQRINNTNYSLRRRGGDRKGEGR